MATESAPAERPPEADEEAATRPASAAGAASAALSCPEAGCAVPGTLVRERRKIVVSSAQGMQVVRGIVTGFTIR
jgi:hypothetical protein